MPKIAYKTKRFNTASRVLIVTANEIIEEYAAQGFELTLRQLYYQFVARDVIPNTEKSYSNLGNLISEARLAGLVDWNAIYDRTRSMKANSHWDEPSEIIDSAANSYHEDLRRTQRYRPQVWIEKDALLGVIEGKCSELDVPYLSCRGYVSQSEMWRAGMRLKAIHNAKQIPVVLHFGDHDPSGIDMSRDIEERLRMFSGLDEDEFIFRRIALTMGQVEEYDPPPNPAKVTDSRFKAYQDVHGDESWELDALEPKVIAALIDDNVAEFTDADLLNAAKAEQEDNRATLESISSRFDEVGEFLTREEEEE